MSSPTPDVPSAAYRRYLFAVIVGVMMLNTVDRHVVAILVDPIKADLGLSDSEMGWILGPSFTLVYTLAVLPLARWADRGVRRGCWTRTPTACACCLASRRASSHGAASR